MLQLLIGQKADRLNMTFKYWIVKVLKGSVYSYSDWFRSTTMNVLLDSPNEDFVRVLKSGTWKPHNGSMENATDEFTFTEKIWIPFKRLIKFGPSDGNLFYNDDDLYVLITCYDAFGSFQPKVRLGLRIFSRPNSGRLVITRKDPPESTPPLFRSKALLPTTNSL